MKKLSSLFFILLSFLVISCSNLVSDTGSIRFVLPENESNSRGLQPGDTNPWLYLILYTKVQEEDFDSLNFSYVFGKGGEEVIIDNLPQGLYFIKVGAFDNTKNIEDAYKQVIIKYGIKNSYTDYPEIADFLSEYGLSATDLIPLYEGHDVATVMAGRNNEFELTLESCD